MSFVMKDLPAVSKNFHPILFHGAGFHSVILEKLKLARHGHHDRKPTAPDSTFFSDYKLKEKPMEHGTNGT